MKRFVLLSVLIFLCSGVFAASVTPGSYNVDFDPGYSGTFTFQFGFGEGIETELYVSGDLAEYVVLDKETLVGGGAVIATLNLPSEVDLPGVNRIRVGARQLENENSGMGVVSNVWGTIKVNVPYSGKFVELDLKAPNANVREMINFSLEIFNRGDEPLTVSSNLQIFREESLIENIDLGINDVDAMSSGIVNYLFDTAGLSAGEYNAVVSGEYDSKIATVENPFKLGEFLVKIVDYPKEFNEDKLERFSIEVESFYNDPIEDLYAEVNVIGFEDASFITPVGTLGAWRTDTLEGFLDTSEIDIKEFQAEIIIHYGEETTSETVDLKLNMNYDYTFILVLLGFFIIFVFLVWRIVVFVKRTGKKSKKGEK